MCASENKLTGEKPGENVETWREISIKVRVKKKFELTTGELGTQSNEM